ncbi:MAG: hypothetical protein AB3N63_10050 [Puniceicoccaceae bacterium]
MRFFIRFLLVLSCVAISCPAIAQEEGEEYTGPWPQYQNLKPESTDETSLKLINLHLMARGGGDSLKNVNTLKMEGVLLEGKVDSKVTVSAVNDGAVQVLTNRFFRGDDYIVVNATGQGASWRQNLSPEKGLPRRIGGLDERLLQLTGWIPWLFVNIENSGHVFSYQGQKNYAGKDAYFIHGWLSNGMQIDVLFDAKSFHIVSYRHVFSIGGKEVVVDRLPTGLSRSGNVWWETGYSFRMRGKIFRKVTYEEVTANASLAGTLFKMPAVRERWLRINPED